jgi:hypothetical protein
VWSVAIVGASCAPLLQLLPKSAKRGKYIRFIRTASEVRRETVKELSYLVALALGLLLLFVLGSSAQYPIFDRIADKVIHKYQMASCEQLWDRKEEPKSQKEQEVIKALRNDPERRTAFIDKVAASIANKLFDCGVIP